MMLTGARVVTVDTCLRPLQLAQDACMPSRRAHRCHSVIMKFLQRSLILQLSRKPGGLGGARPRGSLHCQDIILSA